MKLFAAGLVAGALLMGCHQAQLRKDLQREVALLRGERELVALVAEAVTRSSDAMLDYVGRPRELGRIQEARR